MREIISQSMISKITFYMSKYPIPANGCKCDYLYKYKELQYPNYSEGDVCNLYRVNTCQKYIVSINLSIWYFSYKCYESWKTCLYSVFYLERCHSFEVWYDIMNMVLKKGICIILKYAWQYVNRFLQVNSCFHLVHRCSVHV